MTNQQFKSAQLNSFTARKQYPSIEIALEVQQFRIKRDEFYTAQGFDWIKSAELAQADVDKKYGHLLAVR
jgi:hypothetical protein